MAVELGSAIEQMARDDAKACEAQGKTTVTVLTFPGRNEATIAVRQGRADAFYDTTVILDAFRWDCEGCIPSEVNGCGIDPQ